MKGKQIIALLISAMLVIGITLPAYAEESIDNQVLSEGQALSEVQAPQIEQEASEETLKEEPYEKTQDSQRSSDSPVYNYGDWMGYENEDGTLTVVGIHTLSENLKNPVIIPSVIEGKTVTAIDGIYKNGYTVFDAFSPELVTSIVLPDTIVKFISYSNIFKNFVNLDTIAFPNNAEVDIETRILEHPSLKNISVYGGCSGPTSGSSGSGNSTSMVENITIYEGTTFISGGRFDKLTTLNLPSTTERFSWRESPMLSKLNCPKSTESFSTESLTDCPNLKIPIRTIQRWENVQISGFRNSGITKITIEGLQGGLDKRTFQDCPYLKEINVINGKDFYSKDGVLYWKDDLFAYPAGKSTATNYTLPSNVKCIYAYAFSGTKFTSLTLPEDLTYEYYWDGVTESDSLGNSIAVNIFTRNNMKVRMIKGANGVWWDTPEAVAERFKIDANRVEFYKGNRYSISYELNGGQNASGNPTSYQAGDDTVTLKNPTKAGYQFVGWKRNDIAGEFCNTTECYSRFQNYTFTAYWSTFKDIDPTAWYAFSVNYAENNKLMTGLNSKEFGPGNNLARAQFSVILHRMNGEPAVTYSAKFKDVPKGQWYTNAILWANSIGVVNGYSDTGLFGTGDEINREQMAVMMYRYATYKKYDTSQKADFSKFKDASSVNAFAKEAMSWAVGSGIITGKDNGTKIDPQGKATRAECATIIMRFVEKYE